jgi:plastocyanin
MSGFAFNPSELNVASGDTIPVTNEDGSSHTFTSEEGGFDLELGGGESGEVTVDAAAGEYDFLCTIHPGMTGTLTVE